MSVDAEQLSREELIELAEHQQEVIGELRSEVKDLSARVNALSKQLVTVKTVIAGSPDDFAQLAGYGEGHNLVDQFDIIEGQLDGFAERLNQVPTQPSEQQDTEGRLHAIRAYLVRQAREDNKNIYGADYKEIRALFDGEISDSWASTLLNKAAGTFPQDPEEPKDGFEVADTEPRKKIRVYVDKIEDESLLRLKNSSGGT